MKRLLLLAAALAVASVYFVASALPALSSDSGTVSAKVTAADACITVTPTATIDFGTLPFSTMTNNGVAASGFQAVGYTSCSAATEDVFAKGTDATAQGATWTLTGGFSPCDAGVNRYSVRLQTQSIVFPVLATTQKVESLAAGGVGSPNIRVEMPCIGSDGAGKAMSFQVIFTAAL